MASRETEGKLRVADGLVVIALGVVSLLTMWRNAPDAWFGILQSLMAALLIAWGGVILVGKTRAGRLVRTRRRSRYFTLIGVVLATIIAIVVSTSISTERQEANPAAGLLPAIIGLLVAQLYEQERAAQLKASDLSDRDAGVWKRIALAGALVGVAHEKTHEQRILRRHVGGWRQRHWFFSPAGGAAFPGLGCGDLDNAEVKDQAVAGQTVG